MFWGGEKWAGQMKLWRGWGVKSPGPRQKLHLAYFNAVVQCPPLISPTNGGLLISGTGGGVYQETVTYACETGFNLVGMSERVCQSNGTWSGSAPTCQSKYTFNVTIGAGYNTILFSTQLLSVPLLLILIMAMSNSVETLLDRQQSIHVTLATILLETHY